MSDDQREQMKAMTLDKERAEYLIDNVIITSLKVDADKPFYDFLQVLEEEEDSAVVKAVARDLRSQLGPSMPQPPVQQAYVPQSYSGQPGQPLYNGGLPYPTQPYLVHQPYPPAPYPPQPYYGTGQPPPGQFYSGPNPVQSYPPQGQPYPTQGML